MTGKQRPTNPKTPVRKHARPRLTAAIAEQIASFIRAGGFPEVAAEAVGVPRDVFARWLETGGRKHAREPYRSFALLVQQAMAQARLKAEIEARQKVPRFWLGSGPGRETTDNRGWTGPVKAAPASSDDEDNILFAPEISELLQSILEALEPFPEARAAVARALEKDDQVNEQPRSNRSS